MRNQWHPHVSLVCSLLMSQLIDCRSLISITQSLVESCVYSRAVYMSSSRPFLLRLSTGSARISTPGPTRLESALPAGKICNNRQPLLTSSSFPFPSSSRPCALPHPESLLRFTSSTILRNNVPLSRSTPIYTPPHSPPALQTRA